MKNFWTAFIISGCASVWLFYKFQDHSGRNTKQSAVAASVSGAIILLAILLILGQLF